MKTINGYLVGLLIMAAGAYAYAEHFRATTADLYRESYAAQVRKQAGYGSVNEIRAENYRAMYEQCDKNHNCKYASAFSKEDTEDKQKEEKEKFSSMKPFLHVPVLQ